MTAIVVVGISGGISCTGYISKKLDALLKDIGDYEVHSVNDKQKLLEPYAESRGKKITFLACEARITARQIIAKATYFVIFWSGYDLSELLFFATLNKIPTKIIPIPITTIANKDKNQLFDLYIGRGSPWGNPFPIDNALDVDRTNVIERYRNYFYSEIVTNPEKRKQLEGLRGIRLGCHCKPLPCHGDIIAEYLNNSFELDEPT